MEPVDASERAPGHVLLHDDQPAVRVDKHLVKLDHEHPPLVLDHRAEQLHETVTLDVGQTLPVPDTRHAGAALLDRTVVTHGPVKKELGVPGRPEDRLELHVRDVGIGIHRTLVGRNSDEWSNQCRFELTQDRM